MKNDDNQSVGVVETQSIRVVNESHGLQLESGKTLGPIDVAYETYGKLNKQGDNAVLICHALSGSAHVAGYNHSNDRKPGWWDTMVGPGKAIDTNQYFVICSNCLGGCSGTTGPSEKNPETGRPYGLDFPIITIRDMVTVQKLLLDKLGVRQLLAVLGGSMGGMQVMQWAIDYPEFVKAAIVIASTTRLGAQAIAFDAVGRHSILADAWFQNGQYHETAGPVRGLGIARMIGHITYLSEENMRQKFGRQLRHKEEYSYDFDSEFSIETYLTYQGQSFVERFDANSYLYITKAMDYFDLEKEYGSLRKAFANTQSRFLIVSFTSDWLFTPQQSEEIVHAMAAEGKDVSYCNIHSPYGHDAFLLEPNTLGRLVNGFLEMTYQNKAIDNSVVSNGQSQHSVKGFDTSRRTRVDYELIESLITPNSKILDIGSGDGELLARLIEDKHIEGEGIELDQELVIHSIGQGLSVIHQDIEKGLNQYDRDTFDFTILSQTLQTVVNVEKVFNELLRVSKKVIVSFPNFTYWKCRLQMLFNGRAPTTRQLPFKWYNSPNIHFLSLRDFDDFCIQNNAVIEKKIPLIKTSVSPVRFAPNFFAEQAVYLLSKKE